MAVETRAPLAMGSSSDQITEWQAAQAAGLPVLVLVIAGVLTGAALIVVGSVAAGTPEQAGAPAGPIASIVAGALLALVGGIAARGLIAVAPGQARLVLLFGRYIGTVRTPGLFWVNPFTLRRTISTRIRNHETPVLKVNDADGNPIDMAAVVVWQVRDTARAAFAVNDFEQFVAIQAETAVRHIGTSYPYDSRDAAKLSLRENAEAITRQLSAEIAERVAPAGVAVIESRLTRLAYAPEIAQAMLRRQQADAVVAARQRLVEGAVGMVQLALGRLTDEDIVTLDEERKAAMVSNLLVVLCSEHATQPVVNAGTLYQ
jgi:regulator of protease activity HflC (stomatin/prohibitin superfamily)